MGKIHENILKPVFTCSKLTIETLEQRCQWRRFGGFMVNFEHVIAGWVLNSTQSAFTC